MFAIVALLVAAMSDQTNPDLATLLARVHSTDDAARDSGLAPRPDLHVGPATAAAVLPQPRSPAVGAAGKSPVEDHWYWSSDPWRWWNTGLEVELMAVTNNNRYPQLPYWGIGSGGHF